jgi:hypothetical protein
VRRQGRQLKERAAKIEQEVDAITHECLAPGAMTFDLRQPTTGKGGRMGSS